LRAAERTVVSARCALGGQSRTVSKLWLKYGCAAGLARASSWSLNQGENSMMMPVARLTARCGRKWPAASADRPGHPVITMGGGPSGASLGDRSARPSPAEAVSRWSPRKNGRPSATVAPDHERAVPCSSIRGWDIRASHTCGASVRPGEHASAKPAAGRKRKTEPGGDAGRRPLQEGSTRAPLSRWLQNSALVRPEIRQDLPSPRSRERVPGRERIIRRTPPRPRLRPPSRRPHQGVEPFDGLVAQPQ